MQSSQVAALLKAAPDQHSYRCARTKLNIDVGRWPVAACGLRHAATQAQDWVTQARQLADWCDVQAVHGKGNAAATTAIAAAAGPVTLEALEAGLMALASGLGRDHATRVLQAINGATCPLPIATSLAAEAALVGEALDHDSLEQGEPA